MAAWLLPLGSLLLALLGLLATPSASGAEPPLRLSARVQPDRLTVGDPIQFTLRLEYHTELRLTLPSFGSRWGAFEVLAAEAPRLQDLGGGRRALHLRYTLTLFSTGQYLLPPVEIAYTTEQGEQGMVRSEPIPVTVTSVVTPQDDLRDIKPLKAPIELAMEPLPYWREGAGLLLALLVGAVATLAVKRRGQGEVRGPLPEGIPETRTLAELERIEGLGLLDRGEDKTYYQLLSTCVRRYLQERYRIAALDRTTSELRREMAGGAVDAWRALMVGELLRESDAIKFGRYRPARERAQGALRIARQVILPETATDLAAPG